MSSPISGFTAVPNPQMLAFMPIQSYLMMYFAGSAWQFGKRKISAKSNEEFNKLTMKTLLEEHTMELKSVIPTLEKSLQDVTPLVGVLIEQYGDFVKEALKHFPTAVQNVIGPTAFQADNFGDLKAWLDKNLPGIPKELQASAHETISPTSSGTSGRETTPALLDYYKRQLQRQQQVEQSVRDAQNKPIGAFPNTQTTERKRVSNQTARLEVSKVQSMLDSAQRKLNSMPKTEIVKGIRRIKTFQGALSGRGRIVYREIPTQTTKVPFATTQQILKVAGLKRQVGQLKKKYAWAF